MNIEIKSMVVPVTFFMLAAGATALSAQTMEESSVRAPAVELPSMVISYGDLDVNSAEGRQTLEYRLRNAAKKVCNHVSYRETGSLSYYSKTRACYEDALADALSQVGSSQQLVAVTR